RTIIPIRNTFGPDVVSVIGPCARLCGGPDWHPASKRTRPTKNSDLLANRRPPVVNPCRSIIHPLRGIGGVRRVYPGRLRQASEGSVRVAEVSSLLNQGGNARLASVQRA